MAKSATLIPERLSLDDERLSLNDVAQRRRVHLATVWRWILNGVRGHKLASFLVGGRRFVRPADLERFDAAINGREVPESAPSQAGGDRASAAEQRLAREFGLEKSA